MFSKNLYRAFLCFCSTNYFTFLFLPYSFSNPNLSINSNFIGSKNLYQLFLGDLYEPKSRLRTQSICIFVLVKLLLAQTKRSPVRKMNNKKCKNLCWTVKWGEKPWKRVLQMLNEKKIGEGERVNGARPRQTLIEIFIVLKLSVFSSFL